MTLLYLIAAILLAVIIYVVCIELGLPVLVAAVAAIIALFVAPRTLDELGLSRHRQP